MYKIIVFDDGEISRYEVVFARRTSCRFVKDMLQKREGRKNLRRGTPVEEADGVRIQLK